MAGRRSKIRAALKRKKKPEEVIEDEHVIVSTEEPELENELSEEVIEQDYSEDAIEDASQAEAQIDSVPEILDEATDTEKAPSEVPEKQEKSSSKENSSGQVAGKKRDKSSTKKNSPDQEKGGKKRKRRRKSGSGTDDSSDVAIFSLVGAGAFLLLCIIVGVSMGGSEDNSGDVQLYQDAEGRLITKEEFEAIERRNRELRLAQRENNSESSPRPQSPPRTAVSPRPVITETEDNSEPMDPVVIADSSPSTPTALPGWMRGNFSQGEISTGTSTTTTPRPTTTISREPDTTETSPPEPQAVTPPPTTSTSSGASSGSDEPVDLYNAEGWP